MLTIIDHVENLSKYTTDNKDQILQSILNNRYIIDDDSLLSYSIENNPWGNTMLIMWTDGDGKKIWKWIQDVSKEHDCVKLYCITQRHNPICRKYKFRPIGVLCEREGFNKWEV